jgi:type IV secretory pathway component VirB8
MPGGIVIFVDVDRMITGEFTVVRNITDKHLLQDLTMSNYDLGNYIPADREIHKDRVELLTKFAGG